LFYFSIVISFVILFYFASREKIEKIFKVVLSFSPVILIPPLIDLLVCGDRHCTMTYLTNSATHSSNLLARFLTLGGEYRSIGGITPGIKVELIVVLLASFVYFLLKKRGYLKSVFFAFITYVIFFAYFATPIFLSLFLEIFNKNIKDNFNFYLANYFIIIISLQLIVVLFLYNRKIFNAIIGDMRWLRILYFEAMVWIGLFIARGGLGIKGYYLNTTNASDSFVNFPFPYLTFAIIMVFAWLYSVIGNNIEDFEIDKISNPDRPLVSKKVPVDVYRQIGNISLILVLSSSAVVGFSVFYFLLIFIGNYFIYSTRPFRLKRVPILSKLVISVNSLLLMLVGYLYGFNAVSQSASSIIRTFPGEVVFFVLVLMTLAINFIDIKDYEGDKKAGIKTLPVILGLRRGKTVIGMFFLAVYVSIYFIFRINILLFFFLLIIGMIQFVLINRKKYTERPIFLFILLSILILFFGKLFAVSI